MLDLQWLMFCFVFQKNPLHWYWDHHSHATCPQTHYLLRPASSRTRVTLKSSRDSVLLRRPEQREDKRKRSAVQTKKRLLVPKSARLAVCSRTENKLFQMTDFCDLRTKHFLLCALPGAWVGVKADRGGPEESAGEDAVRCSHTDISSQWRRAEAWWKDSD